jgi:hypothetical protein
MVVLDSARLKMPTPDLVRWLLGLGILVAKFALDGGDQ